MSAAISSIATLTVSGSARRVAALESSSPLWYLLVTAVPSSSV
jgi:hypothetical protein